MVTDEKVEAAVAVAEIETGTCFYAIWLQKLITEGFKKKKKNGNFHFRIWTPPLEVEKNKVIFSETWLFLALFEKSEFSPLKIPKNFKKVKKILG